MPRFKNLKAWQKAHELTLAVYRLSPALPSQERFGLCAQMRRAAVSAAASLAEGRERGSDADFAHFVTMAAGSVAEVRYYLILAEDLGYLDGPGLTQTANLAVEVGQIIHGLRSRPKTSAGC